MVKPSTALPLLFDAEYPRPQLVREHWQSLDGPWQFAFDEDLSGNPDQPFPREIVVPFPPESPASGIHDPRFHPVIWYRRTVTSTEVSAAGWSGSGDRLLLHFGAVDYRSDVWIDGSLVGRHEGGHAPFVFDISEHVQTGEPFTITVRAEDDPLDVGQPRGKQDWQASPHGIWYERTSGIWQPVWLEAVPDTHITSLTWSSDLTRATVSLALELNSRPSFAMRVGVRLSYEGALLADVQFQSTEPRSETTISIARQTNGQAYESLLWSPETPRLIEADITVSSDAGHAVDRVASYLGLRSVGTAHGYFLLNDRPYFVRAVLGQGYWPESHLAAPSAAALRREVELTKSFGFNAIRLHQKVEDPRLLMWADRLGLLVWEEAPSHFEFSSAAASRLMREWTQVVLRDRSHPSIVTWVPLNESWGVQHISHDPAQLHYAQALYHLTKALDPSRPVISNDGWEHAQSDIMTIHDYAVTGPELAANYRDNATLEAVLQGIGPLGRRMRLLSAPPRQEPVMVSEFGGISYAPSRHGAAWGYATAQTPEHFAAVVTELFTALQNSPVLAGFCYTQLADTRQEANGLADSARTPKLDPEQVAFIVRGDGVDTSAHGRPKTPVEQPHDAAQLASRVAAFEEDQHARSSNRSG